eukprot:1083723-Pyramimonas_sp.AAC.2
MFDGTHDCAILGLAGVDIPNTGKTDVIYCDESRHKESNPMDGCLAYFFTKSSCASDIHRVVLDLGTDGRAGECWKRLESFVSDDRQGGFTSVYGLVQCKDDLPELVWS